jgi:hypothetical protein
MRVPILLLTASLFTHGLQAAPLSQASREALLEKLEEIKNGSASTADARFRLALGAYSEALQNDDAVMELYLKCVSKVEFENLKRKDADFREWKKQNQARFSEGGFRLALRYQIRWLMHTLEAASEKPDRARLAKEAQETVDSIFRDAEQLKRQQPLLTASATSSVFAQAYDLNSVSAPDWPAAPLDLATLYNSLLLPPFRNPTGLAALRSGWMQWIQQETLKQKIWSEQDKQELKRKGLPEDKHADVNEDAVPKNFVEFVEKERPKLQWQMLVEIYQYGDEGGAAQEMLSHLQNHLGHPSAKEWAAQLEQLITPPAPVIPPPAKP